MTISTLEGEDVIYTFIEYTDMQHHTIF